MGQQGGEYEPRDSRNVTGTSTNQTGDRWSEKALDAVPPDAAGAPSQAQGGLANLAQEAGEPKDAAARSDDTLEVTPRDDTRREMMNNDQNNQSPTTAQTQGQNQGQNQNQSATGQQPDGTFGQRENSSQGGFGSGQQDQSEDTGRGQGGTQAGAGGHGSGMGQSMGGQQQQNAGGSGQFGSGQSDYNAGQQSQFDAGDSGQFRDQLREHMDVVDANGEHCGTIDSIDGDRIKLTRNDSTDGQHHYVEIGQIAGIEGGQVRLNSTSQAGQADSNAADNWNG
jgi:hypothetical protein